VGNFGYERKRVLKNENEVSVINSTLPVFLLGMSLAKPVFVCVNVVERMRGSQPICGQLWIEEDRQTSATNGCLSGMGTIREAVPLSGIADVLSWRDIGGV
jgi:hypothetical protein